MLLMPDPDSARMDPFTDEPMLNLTCDVIEPSDGKGYDRDPRSIAKRAEAYLKSTGIGDTAYFGPEPEFFIFDSVTWNVDMSGCFVKIKSEEAPWSSGEDFEGGNMGHRAPVKGGYFPVPPVDSLQDIRTAMCLALEAAGRRGRSAPPRSGGRRPERDRHQVRRRWCKRADWMQILKYTVQNVAALLRQDRDLHAEADRRRQRLGHARAPVGLEGRQEPVRRQRLRRAVRTSRCTTSAASSSTPRR